jgi:hypothetical protein
MRINSEKDISPLESTLYKNVLKDCIANKVKHIKPLLSHELALQLSEDKLKMYSFIELASLLDSIFDEIALSKERENCCNEDLRSRAIETQNKNNEMCKSQCSIKETIERKYAALKSEYKQQMNDCMMVINKKAKEIHQLKSELQSIESILLEPHHTFVSVSLDK